MYCKESDNYHNLILDPLKLFIKIHFLIKKIRNLKSKIFLGHEEISF
jgi:hypothetical protein